MSWNFSGTRAANARLVIIQGIGNGNHRDLNTSGIYTGRIVPDRMALAFMNQPRPNYLIVPRWII